MGVENSARTISPPLPRYVIAAAAVLAQRLIALDGSAAARTRAGTRVYRRLAAAGPPHAELVPGSAH